MVVLFIRCIALLVVIGAGCHVNAGLDPEGKELLGTWQGGTAEGFQEFWTIRFEKGKWSVEAVYRQGDQRVGSFQGRDCKMEGGKLTFIQNFLVKPVPAWENGSTLTVTVQGDKLNLTWKNGHAQGNGSLERLKK